MLNYQRVPIHLFTHPSTYPFASYEVPTDKTDKRWSVSLPGAFFPQLFVGEHITCQLNLNMIKVFDIKPLDSVITFLANHHVCVWCFFLVIPQCFFPVSYIPNFCGVFISEIHIPLFLLVNLPCFLSNSFHGVSLVVVFSVIWVCLTDS